MRGAFLFNLCLFDNVQHQVRPMIRDKIRIAIRFMFADSKQSHLIKASKCFLCIGVVACCLGLSVLFQSCLNTKSGNDFARTIHLEGKSWDLEDQLGIVYDIKVGQDFLFLRNKLDETLLTAISLKDKSQIYHFGKRGEGPNELINLGPIMVANNTLRVYDAGSRSLKGFTLEDNHGVVCIDKLLQTNLTGVISMTELSASTFLISGIFPEGRFGILDKTGVVTQYVGSYPIDEQFPDLPFHVLGMAYQSMVCSQPNGTKIATITRYAGAMQIDDWRSKDSSFENVSFKQRFSPEFTTRDVGGTPNFAPSKDTRWGYLSVSATHRYVFCLYSGRLQQSDEKFNSSKEVHVFDWEGNAIYQLQLCKDAVSISVKDEQLFVLIEDPETGYDVVEYQLPI